MQVFFAEEVSPPPIPELKRPRAGAPTKSFMAKGYSGQILEANEIKKREASHDFRAMIRASALAAKDQGLTDAWSVLNALADDISVAKKLKAALNSKTQGISLLSKATTKHCTLCSLFIYMTQF